MRVSQMLSSWKFDTASWWSIAGCGHVCDPGLGDGGTTASRCCGLWTSAESRCNWSSAERAASVTSLATGWRGIVLVLREWSELHCSVLAAAFWSAHGAQHCSSQSWTGQGLCQSIVSRCRICRMPDYDCIAILIFTLLCCILLF